MKYGQRMSNEARAVAKAVRGLIAEGSVKRTALASAMGVSDETLRRRLAEESPFTVPEVYVVAHVLGTTPQAIFDRADQVAS